jgi:hypothetical protein
VLMPIYVQFYVLPIRKFVSCELFSCLFILKCLPKNYAVLIPKCDLILLLLITSL